MSECGSTISHRTFPPLSRHERDGSVPTILEAFPVPPTHIPSKPPTPLPITPHSATFAISNPPPSRPPSLPLPPLPGPSRISEHDLLLLSSANSRPPSKYSASSEGRRDSFGSSSSGGLSARTSIVSVPTSYTAARSPSIASASSRSTRSAPPLKRPSASSISRPSISFSISEESGESIEAPNSNIEQLTRLAISPMPLSDDDFELGTSPPILRSPLGLLRSRRHQHNDSISSIDMRDLPAPEEDEPERTVPPFNAFRALRRASQNDDGDAKADDVHHKLTITVPPRASHFSLADPIDPHTLTIHHCQLIDQDGIRPPVSPPIPSGQSTLLGFAIMSSAPLGPASPLPSQLPVSPPVPVASPPPSTSPAMPSSPAPAQEAPISAQELHREMRAARSKSTNHKQALRARSRSRSKSASRPGPPSSEPIPDLPSPPPPPPPLAPSSAQPANSSSSPPAAARSPSPDIECIISATPRPLLRKQPSSHFSSDLAASARSSFASVGSRSRKSSNVSSSSAKNRSPLDADLKFVQGTWESVDGQSDHDGGDDSDSSIDLHTPLPNLMVKHGLLSPRSKLLPQPEARCRSATPHSFDGRPGSTMSMVTKSGIMKDERNTPMRKERHRDGKLLRGGVGLTTGLGWSDSEDENAPSPLTRRLSKLDMSKRSSASSTRSVSAFYPRAQVSGRHPLSRSYSGGTVYHDVEDEEGVDEWGQRRMRTTSASRGAAPPTSWNGHGGKSVGSRISTSSAGSSGSMRMTLSPPMEAQNASSDDTIHTPSTASSLSIPLPATPQDEPVLNSPITRKGRVIDKDKSLPPLPLQPILKKQPSKIAFPRSRAGSISSPSVPSTPAVTTPTAAAAALARVASPAPMRPLRLPQKVTSGVGVPGGDRPAVPVPSVPPSLRNSASSQNLQPMQHPPSLMPSRSISSLSSSTSMPRLSVVPSGSGVATAPSSPTTGLIKPKPRTGTGMTYRKSSYQSLSSSTGPGAGVGSGGGGVLANGSGSGSLSSRIRAPMPLATASLASVSAAAMGGGGGGGVSGLGMRTRSRTPTTPSAPVGRAF